MCNAFSDLDSDGVAYNWIDGLKAHAANPITDRMMANVKYIYPENTPTIQEALVWLVALPKL